MSPGASVPCLASRIYGPADPRATGTRNPKCSLGTWELSPQQLILWFPEPRGLPTRAPVLCQGDSSWLCHGGCPGASSSHSAAVCKPYHRFTACCPIRLAVSVWGSQGWVQQISWSRACGGPSFAIKWVSLANAMSCGILSRWIKCPVSPWV